MFNGIAVANPIPIRQLPKTKELRHIPQLARWADLPPHACHPVLQFVCLFRCQSKTQFNASPKYVLSSYCKFVLHEPAHFSFKKRSPEVPTQIFLKLCGPKNHCGLHTVSAYKRRAQVSLRNTKRYFNSLMRSSTLSTPKFPLGNSRSAVQTPS